MSDGDLSLYKKEPFVSISYTMENRGTVPHMKTSFGPAGKVFELGSCISGKMLWLVGTSSSWVLPETLLRACGLGGCLICKVHP